MGHDLFRRKQPFSISGNSSPSRGMDVRLAHLKRQPLIKGIAKQEAMDKPCVYAGYADHPPRRTAAMH